MPLVADVQTNWVGLLQDRYVGVLLGITYPHEEPAKNFKPSIFLTSLRTAFFNGSMADAICRGFACSGDIPLFLVLSAGFKSFLTEKGACCIQKFH